MGVNVEFYILIGIKGKFNDFVEYKSKKDPFYNSDVIDGSINNYKNIIFKDYLPDNYEVISDGMGGMYSYIGKVLQVKEYLDEIFESSFSVEDLETFRTEVYNELKNIGINDLSITDIKLHVFPHFS